MVFDDILTRLKLSQPDGRAIHAYRITRDEFEQLGNCLRKHDSRSRKPALWSNRDAAEFCMFAAEWWRRNFDGGAWSWQPILEAASHPKMSQADRTDLVSRGLSYLRRDIIKIEDNRQLLGTLATEGGFPLKLLYQTGSQTNFVRTAFRKMFKELGVYRAHQTDATKLALNNWDVPKTYKKVEGELAPLVGSLALEIWKLAKIVDSKSEKPFIDQLWDYDSNWHNSLPLRIEDAQANALLMDILGEAHKELSEQPEAFKIFRGLKRYGDGWLLEAFAEISGHYSVEFLEQQLAVESGALPYSFQISSQSADGSRKLLATASYTGNNSYQLEANSSGVLCQNAQAAQSIAIGAVYGPTDISSSFVTISDVLEDEPWVFLSIANVNEMQLFTTGSVRSRRDELFIALPDDQSMWFDEGSDGEAVGNLHNINRTLYRIQGRQFVKATTGHRWRFEAQAEQDEHNEVYLRGDLWNFQQTRGLRVFGEHPLVIVNNRRVPTTALRWRTLDGQEFSLESAPLGDGFLQYFDEDILLFQRKLTRLPAHARYRMSPPARNTPTTIILEGFSPQMRIGVATKDVNIMDGPSETDGNYRISVQPDDIHNAPAAITLQLAWANKTSTQLSVAFPQVPARFVNATGHVFANNSAWPAFALTGLTAEMFPPDSRPDYKPYLVGSMRSTPSQSFDYQKQQSLLSAAGFEVSLQEKDRRSNQSGAQTSYLLTLGRIREHIERAFAATGELDASVLLEIAWVGASKEQIAKLELKRYAGTFEQVENRKFRAIWHTDLPQNVRQNYRVIAFPFHTPTESVELIWTSESHWLLPPEFPTNRKACVVGLFDRDLVLRPLVLPAQDLDEKAHEGLSRWEAICELKARNERLVACRDFLTELSQNDCHPDWKKVHATIERTQDMPATAFDLLDALANHPQAAAMALVLAKDKEAAERTWNALEQFAFMWHTIPIEAWENAIALRWQSFKTELDKLPAEFDFARTAQSILKNIVDIFRRHLGSDSPAMIWLNEKLQLGLSIPAKHNMPPHQYLPTTQFALANEFMALRTRQNPDFIRWPEWNFDDVLENFPLTRQLGNSTLHDWELAVAYAPLIAAEACATGVNIPKPVLMRLRRMQSFDSRWFDSAYCFALGLMLEASKQTTDTAAPTSPQTTYADA